MFLNKVKKTLSSLFHVDDAEVKKWNGLLKVIQSGRDSSKIVNREPFYSMIMLSSLDKLVFTFSESMSFSSPPVLMDHPLKKNVSIYSNIFLKTAMILLKVIFHCHKPFFFFFFISTL